MVDPLRSIYFIKLFYPNIKAASSTDNTNLSLLVSPPLKTGVLCVRGRIISAPTSDILPFMRRIQAIRE